MQSPPPEPASPRVLPVIDRIGPTTSPNRWAVMHQKWRDLLFLHWPIRPEAVRPLIPPQLELDLFEGSAFVGLVPFTMKGVRPVGLPAVAGLSSFHETNVRTYVRIGDRDPGVWFFSLDAASTIAVRLARGLFHLPYHYARMILEWEIPPLPGGSGTIVYAGVRRWPAPLPASYLVRAQPQGAIRPSQPGTLEHFLAERYILYTTWEDRLYQGRVHHAPYPLQAARVLALEENLLAATGLVRPSSAPIAQFAAGVDVRVFALRNVDDGTSTFAVDA
jgi:uncharacterized protein YqjF (DUF2071 family)